MLQASPHQIIEQGVILILNPKVVGDLLYFTIFNENVFVFYSKLSYNLQKMFNNSSELPVQSE